MELLDFKNFAKSLELLGNVGFSESLFTNFIEFLFEDDSKLGVSFMQE